MEELILKIKELLKLELSSPTTKNGITEWRLPNGQLHRKLGPALEDDYGHKQWFFNGHRHREDGPAIEYFNGTKEWWINGSLHREDGPAVEEADGKKEYWINGTRTDENTLLNLKFKEQTKK